MIKREGQLLLINASIKGFRRFDSLSAEVVVAETRARTKRSVGGHGKQLGPISPKRFK
jgi:hypothetical protein